MGSITAHSLILPALNLLKKSIPEKEQKLITFYDEDDTVWMPELLKFMDPEYMPPELYVRSQHQAKAAMFSLFGPKPQ